MTNDLMGGTLPGMQPDGGGARASKVARLVVLAGLGAILLSGCSTVSDMWNGGGDSAAPMPASGNAIAPEGSAEAVDDAEPVADLYNKGLDFMKAGSYQKATKQFEEVERQHPYSSWATRATLMSAYADYQRNAYDEAILASQRFITLHPGHKDAAYAYYLIALCYYEQIADVKRDQSATEKALAALDEIGRRFPGTAYAKDAQAKALLARDHLAGKEMEIGRYYQKQHLYQAAIGRFQRVVDEYQTTAHVPEALARIVEVYLALGLRDQAKKTAAVLGYNDPGSEWYQDTYNQLAALGEASSALPAPAKGTRGVFGRAWNALF